MNLKQVYEKPLYAIGLRFPQVVIAFMTALWGLLIALPNNSFAGSSGFALISKFGPEWAIGGLFLVLGLINLHFVITERWGGVEITSAILSVAWLTIGITFFAGAVATGSWVLIVGLAWLFGWSAVEAKHQ